MSQQIDRRSLAKGVAWMAPAITIAAAAPALAASPSPQQPTGSGFGDKCPGASDVPGGFPKHGYRVTINVNPNPDSLTVVNVLLGNGKSASVLTTPVSTGSGWEFVVDAKSSPSKMAVTVSADGTLLTVDIKTHPHCTS